MRQNCKICQARVMFLNPACLPWNGLPNKEDRRRSAKRVSGGEWLKPRSWAPPITRTADAGGIEIKEVRAEGSGSRCIRRRSMEKSTEGLERMPGIR